MPDWIRVASLVVAIMLAFPAAAQEPQGAADPWPQLPTYESQNGRLDITLEAKNQKIDLGDAGFDGAAYNGVYGGPVIHAHPGDTLYIHLINHTNAVTNLHFHGIHTSPQGHGDNIFTAVQPNATFDYKISISPHQPKGLYWYHTHIHGLTEQQTSAGLSGALIIDDDASGQKNPKAIRDRLLVLKDYTFETADNDVIRDHYHKFLQTINGRTEVTLTMHPHEKQLLRITNQSADFPARMAVPGHNFKIMAIDGVSLKSPYMADIINLPPAGRTDAMIDAGDAGQYDIVMKGIVTDSGPNKSPDRVMGHIVVTGNAADDQPDPASPSYPDLSQSKIDAERTIVFTQSEDGVHQLLNGRAYDHARIDTRVPLGSTESWTIKNESDNMHVFHIHQMHFQVVDINGQPQPFNGYQDTVRVPERGWVKIIVPFTDPLIVGKFVYHCHVLEHEDKGMMGNIVVYDPKHFDFAEWFDEAWGHVCSTLGWKHSALTFFNPAPKQPDASTAQIYDGHFNLTDQEGRAVTEKTYDGLYRLMFFGYTHCPDACPTALATLSHVLEQLGDKNRGIAVLFVSLDPERDTPAVLKSYIGNFKTPMTGLTGTDNQIRNIAKNMNIDYAKIADKDIDGGYSIDHPAVVYLMDTQGNYVDAIPYEASPEAFVAFLKKYGAAP